MITAQIMSFKTFFYCPFVLQGDEGFIVLALV